VAAGEGEEHLFFKQPFLWLITDHNQSGIGITPVVKGFKHGQSKLFQYICTKAVSSAEAENFQILL